MPYIMPGGRLFAKTGTRLANHVVFLMFAGGLRQFESVEKHEGNLMPRTLNGNESLVEDLIPFYDPVPAFHGKAIQNFGTLFKEFRYNDKYTQHFNGHATLAGGVYASKVRLNQPLPVPTVFEYYRKHAPGNQPSTNAFWVSDSVGPFLYLNYSSYKHYGPQYAAHCIQPESLYNGYNIQELKRYNIHEEYRQIQGLLDGQFRAQNNLPEIARTEEEKYEITQFLHRIKKKYSPELMKEYWKVGDKWNTDMINMYTAIEVLNNFEPELLVLNMQDIDAGHGSHSAMCNNLRKADLAAYTMWEAIQNNPRLKDDTVFIMVPEHGRNLEPNTLRDASGRLATDHTGDEMSRRIFCLIAGPSHIVKQGQVFTEERGESIDIVPTIGNILGFYDDIPDKPKELLRGRHLAEAFV